MTRLTVERLFDSPPLNGSVPQQFRFAPDDSLLCYLANPSEDRARLDLYAYNLRDQSTRRLIDCGTIAGSGELTAAEKSARERNRAFDAGVSRYRWAQGGATIVCAIDGAIYLYSVGGDTLELMTAPGNRQSDLQASRGGQFISYVRDSNLYVYDLAAGRERQLTLDGGGTISNGIAEFIAQEEMHRFDGHWWSSDDRYVAFTRVDEAAIPVTNRYEFSATQLVAVPQRYPYAGASNASVELGLFELETDTVRWLDYRDHANDYLARVSLNAKYIHVQVQTRDQRTLTLKSFPLEGGPGRVQLVERQSTWVNLHNCFRAITNDTFLWCSEHSGVAKLLLCTQGETIALGDGLGRISDVVYADTEQVLALGWRESPIEQHLLRVNLATPAIVEQLTWTAGWHEVTANATGTSYVDRHSSANHPPRVDLHISQSRPVAISANSLTQGHPYFPYVNEHIAPQFGQIPASDGQVLHYRLTRPAGIDPTHRYPVVISVYGGPGVQRVRNEWAPLNLQLFAQAGMAVFELDNRGGSYRAKAFEDPISGQLGRVEVQDQLAGLRYLQTQSWVDASRIGVMGHSYGGFMSLLLMSNCDGAIRAGICGAPVTDWRLYDTHYTERYLGTPADNPQGYRASSVFDHLESLQGALLLIHGMADDNVLFAHSSRLMLALQQRRVPFELMLYPGAKHSLQEQHVAVHRLDTMLAFLKRNLLT